MREKNFELDTVFIYNLTLDLDSQVLSAAHDWVEAIADQVQTVYVYATKVGRHNLPGNVYIIETGGGSWRRRRRALTILFGSLAKLAKVRKTAGVFHHMSSRTGAILGLPIRFLGVKQALWYSHSYASISMRIATIFIDVLVTSAPGATPSRSRKIRYVGHGIKKSLFRLVETSPRDGVISIGRIVEVKNLDNIINSLALSNYNSTKLYFIGPLALSNAVYIDYLKKLSQERSVILEVQAGVPRPSLEKVLNTKCLVYSGTPLSVDKAVIEAAMCGCFPVTMSTSVQAQTGMDKIWLEILGKIPSCIEEQINILMDLDKGKETSLRRKISQFSAELNDVTETTRRIISFLR
jgi:glycosyltransferase involved in cell wall biosynthesis